ncbi:ABC transporter ATP-binding protein [Marinobacterium lutimaris]|uniref:Putative spermidine/putrescine transport system ATP-binding protein n=1 Tax=Marinobacterium lutimaris TaxID=568106 RepID=A0A1H6DLM9_9GAMM|nr:ABC transporter ATP-binding protein [Marinobacterium lutimaris]SEG86079.1 putative spermidine/putrescine transport system ATP-binding protein [Marinobacterium lutimaris]
MIEFNAINFTYPGSEAGVHDVSLKVETGELVAVLGKSGCGKTTLLKLLAGFEQPDSGEIWINDVNQAGLSCAQRRLGIVFQDYALFPHYSVLKNVLYPLKINRIANAEKKALAMIELVGLNGMEHRLPHQLSGGQRQRVALARALVFEPAALLLDEPLSALDASLRHEMRCEIVKVQRELNMTTFLITHDQEEAMTMANHVAVMQNGRIQQCAAPIKLYNEPNSIEVAGFVGKANILSAKSDAQGRVNSSLGELQIASTPAANSALKLIVRPEKVYLNPPENSPNRFAVDAIQSEQFLGHTMEYRVSINGATLDVSSAHLNAPLTHIAIPPESIHVLYPEI